MQKAIYSVSEAVHFLGIQSHVLRYWEEELKWDTDTTPDGIFRFF